MAYEIKEMTGSLFENEDKRSDKSPDFTGNVKIKGKTWRLAAWNTESRNGRPYMSIAISDPEEYKRQQEGQTTQRPRGPLSDADFGKRRQEMQARGAQARAQMDLDDDDIPF